MLFRLINTHSPSLCAPSTVVPIGNFDSIIYALLLVPEGGTIEHLALTTLSLLTFRYHGATEQTREKLGAVTLYARDGESAFSFLDDVETRIRKRLDDDSSPAQLQTDSSSADNVTRLVQDVLRPAALDAIHATEGREPTVNTTQTYPVFIIRINRKIQPDEIRSIYF